MKSYQKIALGYSILIGCNIGLEGIFAYNPLRALLRPYPAVLSTVYALALFSAIINLLLYQKSSR